MTKIIIIRNAHIKDIPAMVELSDQKRRMYEKAQPKFWKRVVDANEGQAIWFEELLRDENSIILVAEDESKVIGFIIGQLVPAPRVYDPGGLTLLVDDFCVDTPAHWDKIGDKLIQTLIAKAKVQPAAQVVIVCGYHDEPKRAFLHKQKLNIVSEWYTKEI